MGYEISAFPAKSYGGELELAVARHFEALNIAQLVNPASRVVLKPNLLMRRSPDAGTTTHPAMVEAVIKNLRALGVTDITIAESPGGPYARAALEAVYSGCGMTAAAKAGARLNLDTGFRELPGPRDGLCRSFEIITPVAEADLVINLPKLKTHVKVGLSAAVKNLFGCVPGLRKPEFHLRFVSEENFCRMLVELALAIPAPVVSIVDAVESMEGDGPSSGTVRHTGMTFASRDLFALDYALCRYMGLAPESIGTVAYALKRGISPRSMDEIRVVGCALPEIAPFAPPASRTASPPGRGPLRRLWTSAAAALFQPRPTVKKSKCVGCKKCAESCAAKAISFESREASINYHACIRCFCCHEMCPVAAIDVRKSPLMRI